MMLDTEFLVMQIAGVSTFIPPLLEPTHLAASFLFFQISPFIVDVCVVIDLFLQDLSRKIPSEESKRAVNDHSNFSVQRPQPENPLAH